jgi:hypothetical protein
MMIDSLQCRYVSEEFIGIQTIAHGEPDQREDKYILCHLYNQQVQSPSPLNSS